MSFEQARLIADALLRARDKATAGVLAPRRWSERFGTDPWWLQTDCLVEPAPHMRLDVRLRFRHGGDLRELDFGGIAVTDLMQLELAVAPPDVETEPASARRRSLHGVLRIGADPLQATRPLLRLRVRVENTTPWRGGDGSCDAVRAMCFAGTHLLLGLSEGSFVSLLEPPPWAAEAAARTRCVRAYPVLVGAPDRRDLVLASPVPMHDHPARPVVQGQRPREQRAARL